MTEDVEFEQDAAHAAAAARRAIAERIRTIVMNGEAGTEAEIVKHLAEAYASLAVEPPRIRG